MAENTLIEWADHSWNPWVGCRKITAGCDHCYAAAWAKRAGRDFAERVQTSPSYWMQPLKWEAHAAANGMRVRVFPSLCDPFDAEVSQEMRDEFFAMIVATPHLDWLLLTKRPAVARKYITEFPVRRKASDCHSALDNCVWPLPNLWLGVSVENQEMADLRIPILLETPSAVRFLSMEPLLGPVDLRKLRQYNPRREPWIDALTGSVTRGGLPTSPSECGISVSTTIRELPRVDWVIAGGEAGPAARPMHPDWVRSLRDQCEAAGVPFLFKQWGEWREFDTGPGSHDEVVADSEVDLPLHPADLGAIRPAFVTADGRVFQRFNDLPEDVPGRLIERVGKKAAGRLLDGRFHHEFPKVSA